MPKKTKKTDLGKTIREHAGSILNGVTPPKVAKEAALKALEAMSPKARLAFLKAQPEFNAANSSAAQSKALATQLLAGFSYVKTNLLPKEATLEALREYQKAEEAKTLKSVARAESALNKKRMAALGAVTFGELLDDPDDVLVQLFEKQEKDAKKAAAKALKNEQNAEAEEINDEDEDEE